jgi:hypothetical protein
MNGPAHDVRLSLVSAIPPRGLYSVFSDAVRVLDNTVAQVLAVFSLRLARVS